MDSDYDVDDDDDGGAHVPARKWSRKHGMDIIIIIIIINKQYFRGMSYKNL